MIVLASTSKYRRALLDTIGLSYVAKSPHFEEVPVAGLSAEETALSFARQKAESLAEEHPGALIIGADQTAEIDGRILGKPGVQGTRGGATRASRGPHAPPQYGGRTL
jgi:septum formation protein